jgi:hypothetical protein
MFYIHFNKPFYLPRLLLTGKLIRNRIELSNIVLEIFLGACLRGSLPGFIHTDTALQSIREGFRGNTPQATEPGAFVFEHPVGVSRTGGCAAAQEVPALCRTGGTMMKC